MPSRVVRHPPAAAPPDAAAVSLAIEETSAPEDARAAAAEQFLATAKARLQAIEEAERELRHAMDVDAAFESGEGQWDPDIVQLRRRQRRPCLTVNRMPAFRRQITNEQRAARPSIDVVPDDGVATQELAEAYQGIIRTIEQHSHADVAYDTAAEHQVVLGRGWIHGDFEYDPRDGWQLTPRIRRVVDPRMIYIDPHAVEHDYRDARYGFLKTRLEADVFRELYGDECYDALQSLFADAHDSLWFPEGDAVVADYYYIVSRWVPMVIALVPTAQGRRAPQTFPESPDVRAQLAAMGAEVVGTRRVEHRELRWARITAATILEGNEDRTEGRRLPGSRIPLFPVIGEERHVNGRRDYRGIVRDAQDSQRMYNYSVTYEMELIGLQPKQPFIIAEGQIKGHEDEWRVMNMSQRPVLVYKPTSHDGQLVPPPQRQSPSVDLSPLIYAVRQHDNDMKAVIGLFDASLGQQGPEQSGRAIALRQRQGQVSSSHYMDNLARTVRAIGEWLVEIIPEVYDVPRVLRLTGLDDVARTVLVHAGRVDHAVVDGQARPATEEELKQLYGVEQVFDVSKGRYAVNVTTGPSYASRQREAMDVLVQFLQIYPPAAPIIADILAEFSDWPGAAKLAKRFRMINPVLTGEAGDALSPAVRAQIEQMAQALEATRAQLRHANDVIRAKLIEADSRERIAAMDNETKAAIALLEAGAEAAIVRLQEQFATLRNTLRAVPGGPGGANRPPAAAPATAVDAVMPPPPGSADLTRREGE